MGVTVKIDTGGLSAFAARLREMMASFRTEEERVLLGGAEVVAEEAKRITTSKKAKDTIRVIPLAPVNGRAAVAVGSGESGGSIIPLLLEGGNGAVKFAEWKHPVFGTSTTVTQQSHPYLKPALSESALPIEEAVALDIEELLDEYLDEEFTV